MRRLIARLDPHYAKVCAYAAVTVLLTLAAGMLLYFSSGFFAKLWLLICAVLEPTVFGALIAYLLNPLVMRVSRALKRMGWSRQNFRLRRACGIMVCLLGLLLVFGGIITVMTIVLTHSLSGFTAESLQRLLGDMRGEVMQLVDRVRAFAIENGLMSEEGTDLGTRVAAVFRSAKSILSTMVFSVIFSVYILMDGDRVGGYCLRVLKATLGEQGTDRLMTLLADADHVFSGYIRGQFMDALVVGLLSSIVLTLVGVPFGAVVGILTGMGNLIPYVGAPLGIMTTVLVCLVDGQIEKMVIGIVCLAIIMFLDSNVINPKLLSDNIEVHPLLVVAALIAGGAAGGLAGMLVAVPAAAFLKIQLDRWLCAQEEVVQDDSGHSAS